MRPTIICHMGTSIDGGLHPSRFTRPAAGVSAEALRRHYEAVHDRFEADGWIVGRVTMAEMAKGRERAVAVKSPLPREPHLGRRNVKKLLLEGGGTINGAFLKHRLIDEFSTLIYPAIDGLAGRQTIVDYDGADGERPGAGQSLRLIGCETLEGGMVWLRHRIEEAPASAPQG